ncbi:secretion/conjugation apparatus DotM-related subunit [Paracidovorax wautersii]|uniref:DotM C-terminal cytoplasmic domain-containing protein n=1 Tax=Paracidovorax wautersii TaxID=1177982 RepID=A0A1I2HMS3_9BURK|nr:hypothetical protein [Paracidovorax wautersii]SFF31615.1 hypothetical protein SAMN04489711_12711 [Paracidovorax wautersii]
MASPQQNQGQYAQENSESMFVFLAIGGIAAVLLLWFFVGRYVYTWERIALYGALSLWGTFPTDWPVLGYLTKKFLFFKHTHPTELEFVGDVVKDSLLVNGTIIVLLFILVVKRVIYVGSHHPFNVHGRTLNVYDYMFQQMPLYPHLKVMWNLRLLARPLDDGLFRMADSAKRFAMRNKLVLLAEKYGEPVLDEQKARRVFDAQLKTLLPLPTEDHSADARECIKRLTNDEKAVLAAIVCRLAACDSSINDDEFNAALKRSEQLVKQYWIGYHSYKPALPTPAHHQANPDMPLVPPPPPVDTTGCDEVLLKYLAAPRVRESMVSHAYVRTFIYDALQACRKVGKFTPANFRWLRMTDRALWLVVSSAGRSTPFWEAAGLHAHYLWERKAKMATEKPQTGEAVVALDYEFANIVAFSREQKIELWDGQGGMRRDHPDHPDRLAKPSAKSKSAAVRGQPTG